MPDLDDRDRQLLNAIQTDFPLTKGPWLMLGDRLGLTEEEVLERIRAARRQGVLRQISAIFDTRSLGYQSSLVAMRFPPDRVDAAAAVVSAHPGVSHNYRRDHAYNLWFTIAVPPASPLEATVERLKELAQAEQARLMVTLRLFKIGVNLDMTGEEAITAEESHPYYSRKILGPQGELSSQDIAFIRELQEDLPTEREPFAPMAQRLGLSEEGLFAKAQEMKERGLLRRYAAVLFHRRAGYAANAMGVWRVPEERGEEIGSRMARFRAVSHCYLRPTYEDWPYNLFTMIHGRKAQECQQVIDAISQATGITDYAVLYSTKEYKKVRVRYFADEFEQWERTYLVAPVK